ncbi:MAG: hypothetical protein VKM34_09565, partial [Cyanobacteriota bacterium]|nr:hypothetical protein [Cyanobacteriota bacterium]
QTRSLFIVPGDPRPLATVMVGEPTPLAVANLKRLASWCDLILTEATMTFQGQPRSPLRGGWRELLGLGPEQLRVYTMDPPPASGAWLQDLQRNGVLPALVREPPDRAVLLMDADELLDPGAVQALLAEGIGEPCRLGLVPLYGAIDREALSSHCCWKPELAVLRHAPPQRPYLFPGPVLGTVAMLRENSPGQLRRRAAYVDREHRFGVHVTLAGPIDEVIRKLRSSRHVWDERILDPVHLNTMLSAGVHHAGWWIAAHRSPEPWLVELGQQCNLRIAGASLAPEQLESLRAWAQARLDPDLTDSRVKEIDEKFCLT